MTKLQFSPYASSMEIDEDFQARIEIFVAVILNRIAAIQSLQWKHD